MNQSIYSSFISQNAIIIARKTTNHSIQFQLQMFIIVFSLPPSSTDRVASMTQSDNELYANRLFKLSFQNVIE